MDSQDKNNATADFKNENRAKLLTTVSLIFPVQTVRVVITHQMTRNAPPFATEKPATAIFRPRTLISFCQGGGGRRETKSDFSHRLKVKKKEKNKSKLKN